MKPKTKRRKMASCTMYAIRAPDGKWFSDYDGLVRFAEATLYATRSVALPNKCPGDTIVPVRVRELPSARKNAKRTS